MEDKKTIASNFCRNYLYKKEVTGDQKNSIQTGIHSEMTRGRGKELKAQNSPNNYCRLHAASF